MTLCCNITMGFPINVILTEETGLDFFNGFICPNIPVWSLSPSKFTLPLLLPPPLLLTLLRLLRVAPGPPSMMPVITDQVLGLMNTEITGNILWFLQHSRIQLFRVDFFPFVSWNSFEYFISILWILMGDVSIFPNTFIINFSLIFVWSGTSFL